MARGNPAATVFAHELARGATVWGPQGEDITQPVRTAFERLKPACGGNKAVAAVRAVNAALAETGGEVGP